MSELVVGVDFAGPATAGGQRRKILAVAASRVPARGSAGGERARGGRCRYVVTPGGLNARLLGAPPGWTAEELADALLSLDPVPSVVAADFPFCVPCELLTRPSFAAAVGARRPFRTWRAFNAAVAARLPLRCPVDYAPFAAWRGKALWLKRASDRESGAHAPLKDRFQVLFNMTLLGNAFLARLARSGRYDVVPFQARGRARVLEVYPGHAMRALGIPGYKRAPGRAMDAAILHLASHGVAFTLDPAVRRACLAHDTGGSGSHDHDAADALVAACVGALYREGRAREVAGAPAGARDREGAIWSF